MTSFWVLQKRVRPDTVKPEYHVFGKDWRAFDSLEEAQHTMHQLRAATGRDGAVKIVAEVEESQPNA